MGRPNGKILFYAAAALLYAWFLGEAVARAGWGGVEWTRYPVLLPSGLLALASTNHFLKSKTLAWGIFTLGFLGFMAVLGASVLNARAKPDALWIVFLRAMALYLCLALSGFYQLRVDKKR